MPFLAAAFPLAGLPPVGLRLPRGIGRRGTGRVGGVPVEALLQVLHLGGQALDERGKRLDLRA
jgi:hypothetical protein